MKNRKISLLLMLVLAVVVMISVFAVTAFAADDTTTEASTTNTLIPGDVDGDGDVTPIDTTLIRRYIAGYDVTLNVALADVDADGDVTPIDTTLVRRYIAGYDVELLPPQPTHNLTPVAAKDATCTEAGNIAYWQCSTHCDKKFSDAAGTTEVTDDQIVIPVTGHSYSNTWSSDKDGHYHVCSVCNVQDTKIPHNDSDKNGLCDVCGYGEEIVNYVVSLKTFISGVYMDIGSITVVGGAPMTEDNIKALNATRYLGYGFKTWYTDAESANIFDATAPITSDITLYGDRADLAGENITWSHDPETKTLTLTGEGEMFDLLSTVAVPWNGLNVENVVIDSRITSIGAYSFYVKKIEATGMRLPSITLHEGITKIGNYAFYGESLLTEVVFPKSLVTIGSNAFRGCTGLTYIDIGGENLKFVDVGAFAQCENAKYVIFNGAIEGSGNVFESCKFSHAYFAGNKGQYESVDIAAVGNLQLELSFLFFYTSYEPQKAGPYWYRDAEGKPAQWCYSLYYMPSDGKKTPIAKDYVFVKNNKVTAENISFRENIWYNGYQFEGWGNAPFTEGTVINADTHYQGSRGGKVGDGVDYNITDNVLTISGSGKMWNFEEVSAAPWNEITNFENTDITEIVIGANVTYIGDFAFCDFPNLQSVEIKSNIVEMSTKAFSGCANLKYIYYYGNELEALNCKGLNYQENVAMLTVYCQELENEAVSYLTAKGIVPTIRYWKDIEVVPAVLGEDGAVITPAVTTRVTWEFDNETGTLTVGGEGVIPNVADGVKTPWANTFYWIDLEETLNFDAIDVAVKSIVVRDGITAIGDNAFAGITSATNVQLPTSGLKRISATAFSGTDFITNPVYGTEGDNKGLLIVNNNLIKADAATVTNRILIPDSVTSIAEGAFEGCAQVTEIRLPKFLKGVTTESYAGLDSLEKLFFYGNATDWKNNGIDGATPDGARVYFFANSGAQITTHGYYWHTRSNPSTTGKLGTTDANNKDYSVYTPEYVHETGKFGIKKTYTIKVEVVTEPTCTTPGLANKICPHCNEVIGTEEIPVTEHNYVDGTCDKCGATEEVAA